MRLRLQRSQAAQSLVEYVFILGLVTLVAVTMVAAVGQRSTTPMAEASDAFNTDTIASAGDGGGIAANRGRGRGKGLAGHPEHPSQSQSPNH